MAKKNKELSLCIEINLLPAEYRKKKKNLGWIVDRRIVWPTLAMILFAFCAYSLMTYVDVTQQDLQRRLEETKAEVEKERPLLNKINDLDAKLAVITQKRNALKSIQTSKKKWVILFENISSVLPPNMWLSSLQQSGANDIELRGTTFDFSEVAEYMVKLEKQVSISSVTLVTINTSKVDGEDAFTFTMRAGIRENLGLEESK